MNCFAPRVNANDGTPYLLLDSLNGDIVNCRRWDGNSFSVSTQERVRNLVDLELQIIHYYGLDRIEFTGTWAFLWHRYTAFVYIKVGARRAWQAVCQFVFNRRSLASQRRLQILRLLVSSRLSGNTNGLTSFNVMTELYSIRWVDHPAQTSRTAEVELQLDSLVASGDVEKVQISYKATPKALVTLDQTDEQDRRYRETSRLQFWIVVLTLILALAAIVQTCALVTAK